jgi:hypothetical protein
MGGARSTYGDDDKRIKCLVQKPKRKDASEDLGVDGRIIVTMYLK